MSLWIWTRYWRFVDANINAAWAATGTPNGGEGITIAAPIS